MIRLLQHLLDPAYLYAVDPGPLGQWAAVYAAWAAALFLGSGAALWWMRRARHRAATVTAWACGAGLAWVAARSLSPYLADLWPAAHLTAQARFLLFDLWTARVWPISATLVATLTPAVHGLSRLRLPPLLQHQVDAMASVFSPVEERSASWDRPSHAPLSPWQSATLAAIHLVGLAWLWRAAGYSLWWALPSALALSLLPLLVRPHRPRLETLGPLLLCYLASVASFFLTRRLHVDLEGYQGFAFPDPWSPWFNVPVLVSMGVAYTLAIQIGLVTRRWRAVVRDRVLLITSALLIALWLGSTVAVHRTHGVTASDPYCYVQMTIDLAETGSALHDFPLAGLARELGLATWPAVHVGYHPPVYGNRSPTMWSIGWPALMVPFYWLGGLSTLYWVAPFMSALALIATWHLANEALHDRPRPTRWAIAGLTCALVATSPEGTERALVPMADAAAQLFTLLTLWLLLRGRRARPLFHSLLAGASLGVAYLIRHPQLPLAIAALAMALLVRRGYKRRLAMLTAFGLAALVVAIPDLVYHKQVFGGWLRTESSEWFLLSPGNIGRSFFLVLQQGLLRREELGFIAPFALYGVWLLWRRHPRPAAILTAGFLAVFLFHLCYAALRPRDLIAILPVPYLCAAYGFVVAWQRGRRGRALASALWLTCCLTFLFARSYRTLSAPWRDDVITFGHVNSSQYEGYLALRTHVPENAVVGSMLNGGAIELHSDREAVHPAPWSEDELRRWVDALLARGRPFYLLDDGEEMPRVLSRLERQYLVRPVRALDLPYFALGGGNLPRPAWLYQVESTE